MANEPVCSIDGCGKPVNSRGWCGSHYMRWKRHGDPLAGRQKYNIRNGRSCSQCDTENPRTSEYFGPKAGAPDGLESYCRACHARNARISRVKAPHKQRDAQRRYLEKHRERINRERRERSGDTEAENRRRWRAANPEKVRMMTRLQREGRSGEQRFSHAVGNNVREALRLRQRKPSCPDKLGYKNKSWQEAFGYTKSQLCKHIERQFTNGMTWENFGIYWHLDHIVPLASFKYDRFDHPAFRAAWALTNLRPLEKLKNLKKQARRTHLL